MVLNILHLEKGRAIGGKKINGWNGDGGGRVE